MHSFHFTEVIVPSSGEIVRYFDKLPAKASLCCGVNISADTHHDTQALAMVAVSFNGGKDQAILEVLKVKSTPQSKSLALNIIQPLDDNTSVMGYVKDLGFAPAYPYTVKIYYTLKS